MPSEDYFLADLPSAANNHITPFSTAVSFYQDLLGYLGGLSGSSAFCFVSARQHLGLVEHPTIAAPAGTAPSTWAFAPREDDAAPPAPRPFEVNGVNVLDRLAAFHASGGQLKILGWVPNPTNIAQPPELELRQGGEVYGPFLHTLLSALELGQRDLGVVALDASGHPHSTMGLGMIVCGSGNTGRVYIGPDPLAECFDPNRDAPGVCLQGPAVQRFYDVFREHWNALPRAMFGVSVMPPPDTPQPKPLLKSVPSRPEPHAAIAGRTFDGGPAGGTAQVQCLLTAPQFGVPPDSPGAPADAGYNRSPSVGKLLQGLAAFRSLLNYQEGTFEAEAGLVKAIAHAQRYIYIQTARLSSPAVVKAINDRLTENPTLRVIFLHGPYEADPWNISTYAPHYQLNRHLIAPLAERGADSAASVAFHLHEGAAIQTPCVFIDDVYAAVGIEPTRVSLATNKGCALSLFDDGANSLVRGFRAAVWANHCGAEPSSPALLNLDQALRLWHPSWGTSSPHSLAGSIKRKHVPFAYSETPGPAEFLAFGSGVASYDLYDPQEADGRSDRDSRIS
ncbi:MAG TPA: hypothetical protein VD886_26615 [Herpetosiphonaceae bacterium]|nr:hypothetical protein [Herpetosiphonaceae bacterium]